MEHSAFFVVKKTTKQTHVFNFSIISGLNLHKKTYCKSIIKSDIIPAFPQCLPVKAMLQASYAPLGRLGRLGPRHFGGLGRRQRWPGKLRGHSHARHGGRVVKLSGWEARFTIFYYG